MSYAISDIKWRCVKAKIFATVSNALQTHQESHPSRAKDTYLTRKRGSLGASSVSQITFCFTEPLACLCL